MRLLVLPRGGLANEPSRRRIYQFLPFLAAEGFHIRVIQPGPFDVLSLLNKEYYDLALIEEAAFPNLPSALRKPAVRRLPKARVLIGEDPIEPVLEKGAVSVGRIVEKPSQSGEEVLYLPPAPDWLRLSTIQRKRLRRRVVWMGDDSGLPALHAVLPHLAIVRQEHPFTLVTIGAAPGPLPMDGEYHFAMPPDEIELLAGLDFALLPVRSGEHLSWLDRFNLARYASAGLPMICGDHQELVDGHAASGAGYIAEDETTWLLALRKLFEQPRLRQSLGERGRLWAKHERGLRAQAPRLIAFLRQTAARASSPNKGEKPACKLLS
ncbi:MAG: hypothetical protein QNK37_00470 [Acidobacteriota bacterium]|nr:hypothetical protein [Acidobacteriota bacterium]